MMVGAQLASLPELCAEPSRLVLPQCKPARRKRRRRHPERDLPSLEGTDIEAGMRKLMFAVLRQALADAALRDSASVEARMLAVQARAWFAEPEHDGNLHPFAFVTVAETLGLRPDWLRRLAATATAAQAHELLMTTSARASGPRPPKRMPRRPVRHLPELEQLARSAAS